MTREERTKLIKHLKYNRSIGADYLITDNDADEIIKALEQEPCDDVISRQATLEPYKILNDTDTLCVALIRANILQQPPIKPQEKIGHWRPIYQGDEIIDYRCSECEFGYTFGKSTYGMNYCPKCGAKMTESEE